MNEYVFSICIPVYNTEQYLPRALDSIVNQTFDAKKIETVIVNDGSPRSAECDQIITEYSNRLSIQYVVKNTNEGLFLARKTAIEKAAARYILFLDADDSLEVQALQILSDNLINEPDYVQFRIYDVIGSEKLLYHSVLEDEKNKTIADVLQNSALHNLVNKCYNARMLKQIYALMSHPYAVYAEDYYQSAVIEYFSNKKIFIDIPFYNYFRHIGITSDNTFKSREKLIRIIESSHNVEKNLVSFFEENGEQQYARYVRDYIRELYINFAYRVHSVCIIMFIIRKLPNEYHAIRLTIFKKFFLHNIKQLIKNILPYGFVRLIIARKNKI
ncbi:glycosyltransferase family 2 protein [Treponema denticola]|uniref:glycosyltransferase family 2 protein n=1 Tax=Treponema denticola TaxID=158 RepID=UPI0020A4B0B3|nr:glycosyltransferase family 2 protein [Treponema denticola]UTD04673.1 glycosyltransferase family 2 protein [Treponema denticola]